MINVDRLLDILQEIGLSSKEALLYVTCVQLGKQPVSVLARVTKIKRTSVYDILRSLIKKGIAHRVEGANTTYFKVLSADELVKYVESEKAQRVHEFDERIGKVKSILGSLKDLESFSPAKPMVKYFEGEKGMREAYEDTLTSTEDIRAYANIEEMHKGLPHFFPEYYARRSEAGIFIHTICPDNEVSLDRHRFDEKEMREIRFIDKEKFEFTPEINIYDNKVLFASWIEKMAIIIESEEIADFQKKVFDVLYEKLGEERED